MRRILKKHYQDLTREELYKLLRLRSEVFVVEQDCAYQDLDGLDNDAWHIWVEDERSQVLSYLRVFLSPEGEVHIGRVVTRKDQRNKGMGRMALMEGIRVAEERYPDHGITLFAQTYATGFYLKAGFRITGEEFLEDGIPHVKMTLENT